MYVLLSDELQDRLDRYGRERYNRPDTWCV